MNELTQNPISCDSDKKPGSLINAIKPFRAARRVGEDWEREVEDVKRVRRVSR